MPEPCENAPGGSPGWYFAAVLEAYAAAGFLPQKLAPLNLTASRGELNFSRASERRTGHSANATRSGAGLWGGRVTYLKAASCCTGGNRSIGVVEG